MKAVTQTIYGILIAGSVLFASCGSDAHSKQESPPGEQPHPAIPADPGHDLFEQRCAGCHGSDGTAGIGGAADLQTTIADSVAVVQVVSHGRRSMPAFGQALSTTEIGQIARYVKQLHR